MIKQRVHSVVRQGVLFTATIYVRGSGTERSIVEVGQRLIKLADEGLCVGRNLYV